MTSLCLPTRREFLRGSASLATSAMWLPSTMRTAPLEGRLRLASIGVGGMGSSDLGQFLGHPNIDVVALCDIDASNLAGAAKRAPGAATFVDWREMLETMGDRFDAVNVATPDHTHAPASMSAIQMGKHVYCQKPLTHNVYEARQLRLAATEHEVVTQMGIQIHSHGAYRTAVKIIRDGTLGKIKEVHSWSNKSWGYEGAKPIGSEVPDGVDWDKWIGTAPMRPYSKGHYHPGNWRRWCDFGCGTMGDMGIHILDPVANAIGLGLPTSIVSFSKPSPPKDSHAASNQVEYTFAGTEYVVPGFQLTWYDGGMSPDKTDWPAKTLPGQGSMFIGEKGFMLLPHVGDPQLLPAAAFKDYEIPTQAGANHYHLWADACLGEGKTTAGFDYAGPLTEVLLLGVIANRFPTQRLEFDADKLAITNFAEADQLLRREYREGWKVPKRDAYLRQAE
ncbi:MAG: Gfo/Idh/MocA family oxidoreductase [Planctomycetota bacterium]|nr:Gfo/Idh/MocA family oxidoreductase [Planctomycetota bacterium]